jgi:hypothetical protein
VANLPPVSTTLAKMVEKFAAGVVDTSANIYANFRKFETVFMEYSGAGGNLFMKKTRSEKSRDICPFK